MISLIIAIVAASVILPPVWLGIRELSRMFTSVIEVVPHLKEVPVSTVRMSLLAPIAGVFLLLTIRNINARIAFRHSMYQTFLKTLMLRGLISEQEATNAFSTLSVRLLHD